MRAARVAECRSGGGLREWVRGSANRIKVWYLNVWAVHRDTQDGTELDTGQTVSSPVVIFSPSWSPRARCSSRYPHHVCLSQRSISIGKSTNTCARRRPLWIAPQSEQHGTIKNTHTHTCARTHARAHTHGHTRVRAHARTHSYTADSRAATHAHMQGRHLPKRVV